MTAFIYNWCIRLYVFAIRLHALFNLRSKSWLANRKTNVIDYSKIENAIWIHCASAGEFEQALPVIDLIKKRNPEEKIVVSFFSYSGFEQIKSHELVDYFFYLPFDTRRRARHFAAAINPKLCIFVKYEFWYNILNALKSDYHPVVFISTLMSENHLAFTSWTNWFRCILLKIDFFFLQNEKTLSHLKKSGINNATITGDTRIDRVIQNSTNQLFKKKPNKTIVLGSIHLSDIDYIDFDFLLKEEYQVVLVPHQLEDISKFQERININFNLYSNTQNLNGHTIIDTYGLLSNIYSIADMVFIGGGFGEGIHNTLEVAIWRKPIIFGTNYEKFQEAIFFVENGSALSITHKSRFVKAINTFENKKGTEISNVFDRFFETNKGASEKIVSKLISLDLI